MSRANRLRLFAATQPSAALKNYHCRRGEIDLIMRDGETLFFVEVRARRSDLLAAY